MTPETLHGLIAMLSLNAERGLLDHSTLVVPDARWGDAQQYERWGK